MTRITAPHIGIEGLSAITETELDVGLPGRYALPPDGQSIEAHFERLYPANTAEQTLVDFAKPASSFHGLRRPSDFRRVMTEVRVQLESMDKQADVHKAAALLRETQENEAMLQMALNLLHRV